MEAENIDKFGECLAIRQIFIRQLFKSLIEMAGFQAGLLKYFKCERRCNMQKKEANIRNDILPDPNDPLLLPLQLKLQMLTCSKFNRKHRVKRVQGGHISH